MVDFLITLFTAFIALTIIGLARNFDERRRKRKKAGRRQRGGR